MILKKNPKKKTIILSVAGSDSSGGAGIQADIKTVSALGGYAATAITAVTVQNTLGVKEVYPVPAEVVGRQMEAVIEDLQPEVIKIGMISDADTVCEIARVLHKHSCRKVVFDPVMMSTSGHPLMDEAAIEAICTMLFPQVSLVTPNLPEASVLLQRPVLTIDDMEEAARALYNKYNCAFLIKGGHLAEYNICDVLYDGKELNVIAGERIHSANLHGTGCTLSSAIAVLLARKHPLYEAVGLAQEYVYNAIIAGQDLQIGHGNGPLWHFPYRVMPEDEETV